MFTSVYRSCWACFGLYSSKKWRVNVMSSKLCARHLCKWNTIWRSGGWNLCKGKDRMVAIVIRSGCCRNILWVRTHGSLTRESGTKTNMTRGYYRSRCRAEGTLLWFSLSSSLCRRLSSSRQSPYLRCWCLRSPSHKYLSLSDPTSTAVC